jgi:hypothetical protein
MSEERELIAALADGLEGAARWMRGYDKNPEELRAWALRIESNVAPNSYFAAAEKPERLAAEARTFLEGSTS